jgi:hypothetical protein
MANAPKRRKTSSTTRRARTHSAQRSAASSLPEPSSKAEFIHFFEYVDRSVPYVKFKRTVRWSLVEDKSTGLGDQGEWSDLERDEIAGPDAELPGSVLMGDGQIRARLGEIGVSRYEWERLDSEARQLIKSYLAVEAKLAEAVIAAALVPQDESGREFQRKARRFLKQTTDALGRRLKSTSSPVVALWRDRAWHDAQPLLERLTDVLTTIRKEAATHDLVNEREWFASKVAVVNAVLTGFPGRQFYAYCTPEILAKLKVAGPRALAAEIAQHFHRDVSLDDVGRHEPPRQK